MRYHGHYVILAYYQQLLTLQLHLSPGVLPKENPIPDLACTYYLESRTVTAIAPGPRFSVWPVGPENLRTGHRR